MKTSTNYTAIYSTKTLNNIEYAFKAENIEAAKKFVDHKFQRNNFIIRNDDNGEKIEYSNKQMRKYEVEIVFGHSFLNATGRSVYGDNKTRKTILKGDADNEEMAVVAANVAFGVEFKEALLANTYTYKIGDDSSLVLHIK